MIGAKPTEKSLYLLKTINIAQLTSSIQSFRKISKKLRIRIYLFLLKSKSIQEQKN